MKLVRTGSLIAAFAIAATVILTPTMAFAVINPDGANPWVTAVVGDPAHPGSVLVGTAYLTDPPGALYRSATFGNTWAPVSVDETSARVTTDMRALASAGTTFVAGGNGVALSPNGTIWRVAHETTGTVMDVWAAPSGKIVGAVDDGYLVVSRDGGTTWGETTQPAPPYTGSGPQVDATPDLSEIVLGAVNRHNVTPPDDGGGVYVSTDGGSTWTRIGFADQDVSDVAVDPSVPGVYWAVVGGEGYRTDNSGGSWVHLAAPITAQRLIVSGDHVYVGGAGTTQASSVVVASRVGWYPATPLACQTSVDRPVVTMALDPSGDYVYAGTTTGFNRYSTTPGLTPSRTDKHPSVSAVTVVRHHGMAYFNFGATVQGRSAGSPACLGRTVRLEVSSDAVHWRLAVKRTSDAAGNVSARISFNGAGSSYWRWVFNGDTAYSGSSSSKIRITVK